MRPSIIFAAVAAIIISVGVAVTTRLQARVSALETQLQQVEASYASLLRPIDAAQQDINQLYLQMSDLHQAVAMAGSVAEQTRASTRRMAPVRQNPASLPPLPQMAEVEIPVYLPSGKTPQALHEELQSKSGSFAPYHMDETDD